MAGPGSTMRDDAGAIRRIGNCPCLAVNESNMKILVEAAVRERRGGYTVAINAEKIMAYHEDPAVAEVIDQALFPYPDGAGAVMGLSFLQGAAAAKVNMPILALAVANELSARVSIIGADEVSHAGAVEEVKRRFPQLIVVESSHGYISADEIVSLICRSGADLVLLALGSPKQEKIAHQAVEDGAHCLIIGCGGALDILSGKSRRAPDWMVHGNLEWLYRLSREPWRWRRQLKLTRYFAFLAKTWFGAKRG
jgi:N-acetylglucosaminyldiphosphoundecaprenol N-acetyl-beta-D-mannosaminyltransferase